MHFLSPSGLKCQDFYEWWSFPQRITWWHFLHSHHSLIHSVFCLTTGPKPPPKRCLHVVRSRASSFKWEYPLLSLRSSRSLSRLLPRLLATSISPFIFPSITCFRRQFRGIVGAWKPVIFISCVSVQPFDGKGPLCLLRACSRAAHGKITLSCIPNYFNYCVIVTEYTFLAGHKLETKRLGLEWMAPNSKLSC